MFSRRDLLRLPGIFVLSMLGAYACALAFIAVQSWSLPTSDAAHGQGLSETIRDPFVLDIAGSFAGLSGLVIFPIAFLTLRRRRLSACFAISLAAVILEIALITPLLGAIAVPGAFVVLAAALVWCRRSQARFLQLPSPASRACCR